MFLADKSACLGCSMRRVFLLLQGQKAPEVDKATVKELVRQQIAFGKPLFAPWYRDQQHSPQEGAAIWHQGKDQYRPHFGFPV